MEWPSGLVSPLNIPAWRAFPLRDRLAERFGGLPVRVHNDAICHGRRRALARRRAGARSNMLGMVVSTGVGGGLILDGRLIEGASGNAGHIGHVVVYPVDGPRCVCGGVGCLEAIARGPALVEWAQRHGLAARAGRCHREGPGRRRRRRAIRSALAAMRRAGNALGIAIASAMYLCDLEVVAVGGGLSQAGRAAVRPAGGGAARAYLDGVHQAGPGGARRARPERRPGRGRRADLRGGPLLVRRLSP